MPGQFSVALIEPEIPQNTGSIGRLCLATGSTLHLVKPLGFEISDRALKRAGLDYWQYLDVHVHESIDDFLGQIDPSKLVLFSKKAGKTIFDFEFQERQIFVFGRETSGLPDYFANRFAGQSVRIPMYDARVRSLNLATSVGIAVYQAIQKVSG